MDRKAETNNTKIRLAAYNRRYIVLPKYDKISKFGEYQNDWALVSKDGLFGFISTDGKEVVFPKYERIGKGDKIEGIINGTKVEIRH